MIDPSFIYDAQDRADAQLDQREPPATHYISRINWSLALASAIEKARDGDTIVVHSFNMKALAEQAQARMCPGKSITFSLTPAPVMEFNGDYEHWRDAG